MEYKCVLVVDVLIVVAVVHVSVVSVVQHKEKASNHELNSPILNISYVGPVKEVGKQNINQRKRKRKKRILKGRDAQNVLPTEVLLDLTSVCRKEVITKRGVLPTKFTIFL